MSHDPAYSLLPLMNHPPLTILSASFLLLICLLVGCYQNTQPVDQADVVSRLTQLLEDKDQGMRMTAVQALGKMALLETAPALLRSLNDADPSVRVMSAWALGNLGEEALPQAGQALVAKLDDPSPAVKLAAAQAIGVIGGTDTIVTLLTNRLRDPNVATRRAAIRGLLWLDSASASPMLMVALNDRDAQVRQGAVAALGERVDVRALPAIRDRLLKDADAGVRGEAAYRLGKFGDETVVPALHITAARDPEPAVRRWAAWALEQIGATTPSGRSS